MYSHKSVPSSTKADVKACYGAMKRTWMKKIKQSITTFRGSPVSQILPI